MGNGAETRMSGRARASTPIRRHVLDLAERWADEKGIEPDFDAPGFDEALAYMDAEIRDVAGVVHSSLTRSLKFLAACRNVEAMSSEERSVSADARLFLVPIHGTAEAVAAMPAHAFEAAALSLADMGVAHPDSHVLMSRRLALPGSVATATPGAIRRLLNAFLTAFREGRPTEESVAALDGYVALEFGSPSEGLAIPGAFMVGLRVLVNDGWSTEPPVDFLDDFMPPLADEGEGDEGDPEDEDDGPDEGTSAPGQPDAAAEWANHMGEVLSRSGGTLRAYAPSRFDEAVQPLVLDTVLAQVDAERRIRGLPEGLFDMVHYHLYDGGLVLCFELRGSMIGPVIVPYALLGEEHYVVDELMEGVFAALIDSSEDCIFPHDSLRTMPHMSGIRQ